MSPKGRRPQERALMNSTPNQPMAGSSVPGSAESNARDSSPSTIRIQVSFFALARQLAGQSQIDLSLAPPATIADVRRALLEQAPALASLLPHSMFAIGTDYAGDEAEVRDGDQLALIPPVSGG